MLFQIARDELGTKWEKIPTDTDILVMCLSSLVILSAQNTDTKLKAMQCTRSKHPKKCERTRDN